MTESSSFEHPSRVGPSDESDGHHTPGLRRREFSRSRRAPTGSCPGASESGRAARGGSETVANRPRFGSG